MYIDPGAKRAAARCKLNKTPKAGSRQEPARLCRDVAQPGRALAWGARGRQFKSARPDHLLSHLNQSFSSDLRGRPTKHPNLASRARRMHQYRLRGVRGEAEPSAVQICPSRPITFSNQSFSSDIRGRPTKHPNLSSAAADDTNRDCEGCEAKPSPSAVQICPSRPFKSIIHIVSLVDTRAFSWSIK